LKHSGQRHVRAIKRIPTLPSENEIFSSFLHVQFAPNPHISPIFMTI
jgi:hypothetical protein